MGNHPGWFRILGTRESETFAALAPPERWSVADGSAS